MIVSLCVSYAPDFSWKKFIVNAEWLTKIYFEHISECYILCADIMVSSVSNSKC